MKQIGYDQYDYKQYWQGREYEHQSEVHALKHFIKTIGKRKLTVDVGSGFGRLAPIYLPSTQKAILLEPSKKHSRIAQKDLEKKYQNFKIVNSQVEEINRTIKEKPDLIIMVRVLHHIKDLESVLNKLFKLLKPGGYFILEFANKEHAKATIKEVLAGNITFPWDILRKDIRSKHNRNKKTLPFINYHPEDVKNCLLSAGFEIEEIRSVSNFRNKIFKTFIPLPILLAIERCAQNMFGSLTFGPSIFILARKPSNTL